MAQTLLEVREQIAKLQQDEARLKKVEAAGVISRIKVAIEAYGFAPEDLFDMDGYAKSRPSKAPSARTTPAAAPAPTVARAATKTKAKPASQPSATARYADGAAKEWSGRGPRPLWLRSAIEGGRALEEFAVGAAPTSNSAAAGDVAPASAGTSAPKKAKREQAPAKRVVAPKYKDGANQWSGRGSQPRWLKEALAAGKSIGDFAI